MHTYIVLTTFLHQEERKKISEYDKNSAPKDKGKGADASNWGNVPHDPSSEDPRVQAAILEGVRLNADKILQQNHATASGASEEQQENLQVVPRNETPNKENFDRRVLKAEKKGKLSRTQRAK